MGNNKQNNSVSERAKKGQLKYLEHLGDSIIHKLNNSNKKTPYEELVNEKLGRKLKPEELKKVKWYAEKSLKEMGSDELEEGALDRLIRYTITHGDINKVWVIYEMKSR